MKPVDNPARRMLQELGRALVDAVASSPEVSQAVRRIREQDFSIYLVLEPKHPQEKGAQIELTTRSKPAPREPSFVLGGEDVTFLKSVGIDPTRHGRRHSSS